MLRTTRNWLTAASIGLLVACGGGGGGDRAEGVEPGDGGGSIVVPPPVVPDPTPAPYVEAEELLATITSITLDGENRAIVEFQLTNGSGTAIVDLEIDNLRFVISKLQVSPLGNLTGTWQSYVNVVASPEVGTGTEPRLQATYERGENFVNNQDGTYQYTFDQSLTDIPADVLAQAETEGLDLSYDANLTHRVAMQFDGNPNTTANPFYDWVPANGATSAIFTMDIAATANCNNCHDPLGIHGGNRREIQYCVTCHNAGSTDPDSTNTVDMKVMIHKIHMGKNLPSVQEGGQYVIYGFRNSPHDYSELGYPQDIRNCVNCHAGPITGEGRDDLVLTAQGDNWSEYGSTAACGSCHENATGHMEANGDENCASCHSSGGAAGSIAQSHVNLVTEAGQMFASKIEGVSNTMPGEFPAVNVRISNPETGEDYDLLSDPVMAGMRVTLGWDTRDYTNTGAGGDNASTVSVGIPDNASANGDGSFTVTSPTAIPDGSEAPGIAASGSGAATVEGHPDMDVDGDGETESIPVTNVSMAFSINEADGAAVDRRTSVTIEQCNACHSSLVLHGGNRTDDIGTCVTCHNPRNTDARVREVAMDPPTDGKDEESIDFKTMVHGIHAPSMRENALEIVGFRGFSTHRYDEEHVHYPGDLSNCTSCHVDGGFTLPLADGVLGTSIDTGENRADPTDDTVVSPASAVCSSCHDDAVAQSHMTSNGGNFATTQAALDAGEVVEECSVCHKEGATAAVSDVHNPH
ncbi:OmcA/MtrC family decaheme c-type cytochrome [Halioglobus maricola]|nr:OmcA/MtrC family decaheme c-type cytochrome [Halioglobus maricola]